MNTRSGWCNTCNGVERVERTVLRYRWIANPPHYDFSRSIEVDLCQDGHALRSLCIGCELRPAQDRLDHCTTCWPEGADDPLVEFKRDVVRPVAALVRDAETDAQIRDGMRTLFWSGT